MTIKNIVALAALLAVLAAGDAFLLARVDAWGAAVLALQAALVAALVCLFLRQASLNRARREEDPAMALFPLPARFRLLRRGETPGRRPDAAWREAAFLKYKWAILNRDISSTYMRFNET